MILSIHTGVMRSFSVDFALEHMHVLIFSTVYITEVWWEEMVYAQNVDSA
jgi:hypothetical protein